MVTTHKATYVLATNPPYSPRLRESGWDTATSASLLPKKLSPRKVCTRPLGGWSLLSVLKPSLQGECASGIFSSHGRKESPVLKCLDVGPPELHLLMITTAKPVTVVYPSKIFFTHNQIAFKYCYSLYYFILFFIVFYN